jgi:hypothetical protein
MFCRQRSESWAIKVEFSLNYAQHKEYVWRNGGIFHEFVTSELGEYNVECYPATILLVRTLSTSLDTQ